MTTTATTRLPSAGLRPFLANLQGMALPVLAVATVTMLVLPLPPWLLDALIAVSISAGLALLVFAIYVKSPVHFSTFPGLLLLTTLFRIALNVATSRQILLTGDGGHIIETFGSMVVGGNLVVGLVIFAIVALVQFMVIAKGAERVAEVAARFTLDAMPGKQVSIDSDVRSGTLTQDQARVARTQLASESQMFGAMDGAMKFVKGDVIAGMVIVLINMVGGILVGMFYHGMTASDAANHYAVLAVGDGLVSQIPALMVAMAAGMLVTRAASENSPDLGGQIAGQLLAYPRALMVTGGITLTFMLVPGFPVIAFVLVGGGLLFVGWRAAKSSKSSVMNWAAMSKAGVRDGMKGRQALLTPADSVDYAPLILELSPKLVANMAPASFEKEMLEMRARLVRDMGLPFPGMLVRRAAGGEDAELRFDMHDVPLMRLPVVTGSKLVFASEEQLRSLGVTELTPMATQAGAFWVPHAQCSKLDASELGAKDTEQAVLFIAENLILRNAHDLLGLQDTKSLLTQCETDWPDLTKEATSAVPLPRMNQILRNLLRENVPIRDMRSILQALTYASQLPNDDVALTEAARQALSKTIMHRIARGANRVRAIMLGANVEQYLRDAITNSITGPVMSLPPEQERALEAQIVEQAQQAQQKAPGPTPIVLVAPDLRWHVRGLLHDKKTAFAVLSTAEVPGYMSVVSVGMVNAI
jgi:type III secretion protein V